MAKNRIKKFLFMIPMWHACISINSKNYTIGRFDSLEEAALARRNYANEIYKDFAKENL